MVRMRDVLRSSRDVFKNSERSGEERNKDGETGFNFPDSSRPIQREKRSEDNSAPESTAERKTDPSQRRDTTPSAPQPTTSPIIQEQPSPQKASPDQYRQTIEVIDEFMSTVVSKKPLDIGPVEEKATLFAKALKEGDQLFMQALSARRSIISVSQHSTNVAIVAIKVAHGMNYKLEQVVEVGICAMVHEVGMSRVPDEVVNKKGELTPSEYEMIKQHPLHGKAIMEEVRDQYPFLPDVIVQEHERWNGNGYPFGLKENEIHEYAQILGIADTFVALTHLRHYRDNFIAYKAIQSIIERRNIDFSAKMIKVLIDVISIFPVDSLVKLNDGSVARVVKTNKSYPVRPIIKIVMGSRGEKITDSDELDLSKEPMIYIVSPVLDESAYS